MLAGLMSATVLGGIAPAYAQSEPRERGNRSERMQRPDRNGGEMRGNAMRPARPDAGPRVQQPSRDIIRPDPAQRDQQRRDQQRPDPRMRTAPDRNPNDRVISTPDQRGGWQDRRYAPRDARNDRRDGQQDWRNDRRDQRRDDRQDGRGDPRNDQRWNNNRGWVGGVGNNNWNNGRRYDDRTRWNDQRRWDNGWRQDRRYDWNSYRSRNANQFRMGRYYAPRGWDYGYRRFSVGITLSSLLYANNFWLNDPYAYRLPPAYGTLRWIRYYDDALLVDIRDGYVVDVINGFFW